jgi:cell division protein FtsI (penicillin-binding protein 3)
MDRRKELLIRAYVVMVLFVVYALVIVIKIGNITFLEGEKWRSIGEKNVKWIKVEADRGNIFDVNGNLLATSLPFFDIRIDLKVSSSKLFESELDSLCMALADFPGTRSASRWKNDLLTARLKGNQYYLLARKINYAQLEKVKLYPLLRYGRSKAGLIIEKFNKRSKPFDQLASRTIGLDRDNADKVGLEAAFDKYLKGQEESVLMKRLPGGHWIPVYNTELITQKKGNDIVSTIDVRFQDILHDELVKACSEYDASKGAAIIMEVQTGKIKAISNVDKLLDGSYQEIDNHTVKRLSEPGSTMKLASTLALLESGIDLDTEVNLNGGKKKFHDLTMYDSDMHGKYRVDLRSAFKTSSNVGIASLVNSKFNSKEGRLKFYKHLESFGLTAKSGVDLLGESDPLIKHPEKDKTKWSGTTIPWMAHGYELMQTPLQVLNLYNAIANDGAMMQPYLVEKIQRNGQIVKTRSPKVLNEMVADPKNVKKMQTLLRETVTDGTGGKADIASVSIAGKTGTTRVDYWKNDEEKKYNASFVGYFPADDPKYSMIVVVYGPKGKYYGGSVAAPGFAKIAERIVGLEYSLAKNTLVHSDLNAKMDEYGKGFASDFDKIFHYMDVDFESQTNKPVVELKPLKSGIVLTENEIDRKKMPDVVGMGLKDATYVLESLGYEVVVNGYGKVAKQTAVSSGAKKRRKVEIYLN